MKRLLTMSMVLGLMIGPVATAEAAKPESDHAGLVRLAASDAMPSDRFGVSVAVSGDTALVGAPVEDAERGAAYVFRRVAGAWREQAKLVASDGRSLRKFGFSVALDGDTAVVGGSTAVVGGSDYHADPSPGAVYVFERVGDAWVEQAKLTAPDGVAEDGFGGSWTSVAVSGDTVVVGAQGIGVGGAAYVFVRAGGAWGLQAKLTASEPASGDNIGDAFGFSVAVSGNTAVVGAPLDDVGSKLDQGAAYVFTRDAALWTEEQQLSGSVSAAGDNFGFSVGVSTDTVVVSAPNEDVKGNANQGAGYVFARKGRAWPQQAHLTADDGAKDDLFGRSAAVSGDTVILGAQGDKGDNIVTVGVLQHQEGSAYVFTRRGGTWPQRTKLVAAEGLLGVSAAISGGTAVIGAPFENLSSGAAYVWEDPLMCVRPCGSHSPSSPTRTSAAATSVLPAVE